MIITSPLSASVHRGLSPIHFSPALFILQVGKHETLTQYGVNVGPPSTTLTQPKPSIGLPLNVGQRHRRRANINPALVQSMYWIGLNGYCPAPATLAQHSTAIGSVSACTLWTHHSQQKALSSVEWLMARSGDDGPVLIRHWFDVSCLLGIVCRRIGRCMIRLHFPANTG